MAEGFLTVDPFRTSPNSILGPGEWLEYYCPECKRPLSSKYGLFFHREDESEVCGGRSRPDPGPLLAKVVKG